MERIKLTIGWVLLKRAASLLWCNMKFHEGIPWTALYWRTISQFLFLIFDQVDSGISTPRQVNPPMRPAEMFTWSSNLWVVANRWSAERLPHQWTKQCASGPHGLTAQNQVQFGSKYDSLSSFLKFLQHCFCIFFCTGAMSVSTDPASADLPYHGCQQIPDSTYKCIQKGGNWK